MAKRKITVTVDEELVAAAQHLGDTSLSAVVNMALINEMDRRARARALQQLVEQWDSRFGPVPGAQLDAARAAFDELDGVPTAGHEDPPSKPVRSPRRKRGAA